jgi:hypothetical protein
LPWTLDENVAATIPRVRFRAEANPWVIAALAAPEDVIACLKKERAENEIVIDPREIVKVLKDEPASEPVRRIAAGGAKSSTNSPPYPTAMQLAL